MDNKRDLSTEIELLKKENLALNETLQFNEKFSGEYLALFNRMNEGIALNELVYNNSGEAVDYLVKHVNTAFAKILDKPASEVINKTSVEIFNSENPPFLDIFVKVAETGIPVSLELFFAPVQKYFKISAYSSHKGNFATVFEDISHRKYMENTLRERIISLTQPIGSFEEVRFTDLFNIDEIQKIQDTFAEATGVASIITTPDGTPITKPSSFCNLCINVIRKSPKGLANCMMSDSIIGAASTNGPNLQPCLSGGLYDGGAGITVGNHHIANWLIGQVMDEEYDVEGMRKYAREIEVDEELFMRELKNVYKMPKSKFRKICEALYLIANQISELALNNLQQARYISERFKNEEKIKNLNTELLQKNKELEEILYVASHDLRSPLVNIQGFSKELKEGIDKITAFIDKAEDINNLKIQVKKVLDENINESFDYIFKNTRKMDLLLSGLLRLSRIDRSAVLMKNVRMNNLVKEVLKTFDYQIQVSRCEIITDQLPDCYCDEFMVFQVLSNYIDNAIKFISPDRQGRIKISGKLSGDLVVYCIADNGKGISLENKEKIFNLFERLDHKIQGEGLGLTIVKKIISKHSGSCWVESEPGNGSSFYFSLPQSAINGAI